MPFVGVLGLWAFGIVCLSIIIVTFYLKMQYDKEQKKTHGHKPATHSAKPS